MWRSHLTLGMWCLLSMGKIKTLSDIEGLGLEFISLGEGEKWNGLGGEGEEAIRHQEKRKQVIVKFRLKWRNG